MKRHQSSPPANASGSNINSIVAQIARCTSDQTLSQNVHNEISEIANSIGQVFAEQFERTKDDFKRLKQTIDGGRFPTPILRTMGKGKEETLFTQLFRYFLDPSEVHGLNCEFLWICFGAFLKQKNISKERVDKLKENVRVIAEFPLGTVQKNNEKAGSRIDLFVESAEFVILIENKIHSRESNDAHGTGLTQLKKYNEAFKTNKCKNPDDVKVLRVYLTPQGVEPRGNEDVDSNEEWKCLSYSSLIAEAIRFLDDPSTNGPKWRGAKLKLASFVWELICGPLDKNPSDLFELAHKIERCLNHPEMSSTIIPWCNHNLVPIDQLFVLGRQFDEQKTSKE